MYLIKKLVVCKTDIQVCLASILKIHNPGSNTLCLLLIIHTFQNNMNYWTPQGISVNAQLLNDALINMVTIMNWTQSGVRKQVSALLGNEIIIWHSIPCTDLERGFDKVIDGSTLLHKPFHVRTLLCTLKAFSSGVSSITALQL